MCKPKLEIHANIALRLCPCTWQALDSILNHRLPGEDHLVLPNMVGWCCDMVIFISPIYLFLRFLSFLLTMFNSYVYPIYMYIYWYIYLFILFLSSFTLRFRFSKSHVGIFFIFCMLICSYLFFPFSFILLSINLMFH